MLVTDCPGLRQARLQQPLFKEHACTQNLQQGVGGDRGGGGGGETKGGFDTS